MNNLAAQFQGASGAQLRLKIWGCAALILIFIALCAPFLAPHDPYAQNLNFAMQPPSREFFCGTDAYGRCIFSRVIAGSTLSIFATLALVIFTAALGIFIGLFAAVRGGFADNLLMRAADIFLAFPGLVLALAVAASLGGGIIGAMLALACINWPKYARLMRSRVLAIKKLPYIFAAKTWGYSEREIFYKLLLPAALGPALSMAALDIGTMLLELAALSFLGLGAAPPAAEWGAMMAGGRSNLQLAPWTIFAPAAALFITVSIFNLLGETLREILDADHR